VIIDNVAFQALPPSGFLRSYCMWAFEVCDAPLAYHVGTGLSLMAAVAPANLGLPWAGGFMPANLWCMLVGPSGDRKTTAIARGTERLAVQCDARLGEDAGSKEAAYKALSERPQQLLVLPEFGDFLAATTDARTAPIRPFHMQAYDGYVTPKKYNTRQDIRIVNPRLSILAGIAPSLLAAWTRPVDFEGGYIGRYCIFFSERSRTTPIPGSDPEYAGRLSEALYNMMQDTVGRCLGFTPEAAVTWAQWNERLMTDPAFKLDERMAGAINRLPTSVLKAVLLYAFDSGVCREGRDWWITPELLQYAFVIGGMHALSLRTISERVSESKDMKDRKVVLDVVGEEWTTMAVVIRRARLLKRRAAEIVDSLIAEGAIEQMEGATPAVYRRRTV